MRSGNFLQGVLGAIVSSRNLFGDAKPERSIEELCSDLLANGGEVSAERIGGTILAKYQKLDADEKTAFFVFLTEELDLDAGAVVEAAENYGRSKSSEHFQKLLEVAEPSRQELLRRLNRVPGATQALVSMRADLLTMLKRDPSLKRTDFDFEHLLGSWFNRGFLQLRRVSWESSAKVLAKIIQYETVHAINDWNDLQRRLEPTDRRCFAFFHPAMPDGPLVFVEIALCKGIPSSVQKLLDENRKPLEEEATDTAVFYSISNCQMGLKGVSFGNSLIKQVASDLSAELPNLKNFVTLSPIPGLAKWVEAKTTELSPDIVEALAELKLGSPERFSECADDLKAIAAQYLLKAKRDDGFPLDAVARFHLGNGACVHQIHALADSSAKGKDESYSVMVNYLYDMGKTEIRHEDFLQKQIVHASKDMRLLAENTPRLAPIQTPRLAEVD